MPQQPRQIVAARERSEASQDNLIAPRMNAIDINRPGLNLATIGVTNHDLCGEPAKSLLELLVGVPIDLALEAERLAMRNAASLAKRHGHLARLRKVDRRLHRSISLPLMKLRIQPCRRHRTPDRGPNSHDGNHKANDASLRELLVHGQAHPGNITVVDDLAYVKVKHASNSVQIILPFGVIVLPSQSACLFSTGSITAGVRLSLNRDAPLARSTVPKPIPQLPPGLVPHPRFGDKVVPSGCRISLGEIRSSYWGYHSATIFLESAIPADTTKQNFSVFPRGYYVDMLKRCRDCGRPFLFFAREQQFWYESLGFYIDADCADCPECRHSHHELRKRFHRYAENIGRPEVPDKDFATLMDDAVFLWKAGILTDEQKLRRLRNLAKRQIPDSAAAKSIDDMVAGLRPGESP